MKNSSWKYSLAVIISLIIFWPIGVFLMWKYTLWPRIVKWTVTLFFIVGTFTIFWNLLFWARQLSESANNWKFISQGQLDCQPSAQVVRCTQTYERFSFEYPLGWNHDAFGDSGELLFGPTREVNGKNYVVRFFALEYISPEEAKKDFEENFFGDETIIHGLRAKMFNSKSITTAKVLNKKQEYTFLFNGSDSIYPIYPNNGLTKDQAKQIFFGIVQSFMPGN